MGPNMKSTKRLANQLSLIESFLSALLLALSATVAVADEPAAADSHPNGIRVGMYFLSYSASASDLQGPFTPAGINLDVKNVNTPYAAYTRELSPHWVMELAAGVPPTTHTLGKGPATLGSVPFNGQEVATAKWFSPTLLFNYVFLDPKTRLRPYLGFGVNFTRFYERNSTAAGNAANGGPTSVTLSDSIGPAGTVGATYRITDRIAAFASYSMAQINSNYSSNTSGIIRKTTVNFNPKTAVVSLGYSF